MVNTVVELFDRVARCVRAFFQDFGATEPSWNLKPRRILGNPRTRLGWPQP